MLLDARGVRASRAGKGPLGAGSTGDEAGFLLDGHDLL